MPSLLQQCRRWCLAGICALSIAAPASAGNLDEMLELFHNILKDIPKQRDIEQRYHRFARAEEILPQIGTGLAPDETEKLVRKLSRSFRELPPPVSVRSPHGLQFHRQKSKDGLYYWSDAVTEQMFGDFLTAKAVEPSELAKWLPGNQHSLDYRKGVFVAKDEHAILRGITYSGARAYSAWLSTKRRPFRIPGVEFVPDDPPLSCWTSSRWTDSNYLRMEMINDFGGDFRVLVLNGQAVGELPEAAHPDIELRLIISTNMAKKLYLDICR